MHVTGATAIGEIEHLPEGVYAMAAVAIHFAPWHQAFVYISCIQ